MSRISKHTKEETQAEIKKIFIKTYLNAPLEKITISSIAHDTHINRGTFYKYYKDIYDLLEQIEADYIMNITPILHFLLHGLIHKTLLQNIEKITEFYIANRDLLMLFLVKQPNERLIKKTKNIAKTYAMSEFGLDIHKLTLEQQCLIEYTANAQLGMIGWWLEHGELKDLQILAHTMILANTQGPMSSLIDSVNH